MLILDDLWQAGYMEIPCDTSTQHPAPGRCPWLRCWVFVVEIAGGPWTPRHPMLGGTGGVRRSIDIERMCKEEIVGHLHARMDMWLMEHVHEEQVREVPASWWQHFKRDVLPECFRRRWPVLTDRYVLRTVHVCPHHELSPKNYGHHVEFVQNGPARWDRGEPYLMAKIHALHDVAKRVCEVIQWTGWSEHVLQVFYDEIAKTGKKMRKEA